MIAKLEGVFSKIPTENTNLMHAHFEIVTPKETFHTHYYQYVGDFVKFNLFDRNSQKAVPVSVERRLVNIWLAINDTRVMEITD